MTLSIISLLIVPTAHDLRSSSIGENYPRWHPSRSTSRNPGFDSFLQLRV